MHQVLRMAKSIVQNANATVRLSLSFLCPTMRGLYTLLPPEAEKKCYDLISGYKNLTIKTVHSRKRTLGNYRQCADGEHLITINDNLPHIRHLSFSFTKLHTWKHVSGMANPFPLTAKSGNKPIQYSSKVSFTAIYFPNP